MAFDPRILENVPFVPHDFETLKRAYPVGSVDEHIHAATAKMLNRVEDVSIRRIRYAVDKVEVTGVLLEPKDYQPGKHPIMVFNRGGNGEYGMVATPLILRYMLPFARQGYLVVASNYRGNDGGTGQEEFGGADVQDVLTLLDITQHHPGWDGKNRFMFGASRGGMMTYLSIKHGAPLSAAATFGGVSDIAEAAKHRPDMIEKVYAKRFPNFTGDLQEEYVKRSAVLWPEALASVPLLMAHGTADSTVLPGQSEALDAALTRIDAPHKLVLYEGGNHPLSTHLEEWLNEVTEWFRAYTR